MQLTEHGTVRFGRYNLMYTREGRWSVFLRGRHVGYVNTLCEVESFVREREETVRQRAAEAASMRHGEGAGIDPNHA